MTLRLISSLAVAFFFFLFLGYLNPSDLTFFYAPDKSIEIPYVALLLIASFAGASALAFFYVLNSVENFFGGLREWWHRRKGERLEKLSNDAISKMSEGEPIKGLRKIEKVLGSDPRNFDALLLKGSLLRDLGRHKEALEVHSLALAYRPSDRGAVLQLKEDYRKAGNLDAAYRLFERVREKTPKDVEIISGMRELSEEQGDLKRAIILQKEIVKNIKGKVDTDKASEKLAILHAIYGSQLGESGEWETALSQLEKARKTVKGFLPAIIIAADIYEKKGDTPRAESFLRSEFKRTLSIIILVKIESILRKSGRENLIEELYREGIEKMGRMPDANNLLIFVALAQVESGDLIGAEGTLNRGKDSLADTTIYNLVYGIVEAMDKGNDFPAWFHKALEVERARFLLYRCRSCGRYSENYSVSCSSCGEWNSALPEFGQSKVVLADPF